MLWMFRLNFLYLITLSFLLSIYPSSESFGANEKSLLKTNELYIGYVDIEKGLACGDTAAKISDIHKKARRPLNLSLLLPPKKTHDPLLGLVIQIIGQNNVCKDLEFNIHIKYDNIKKNYLGLWKSTSNKCPSIAHASTTDWWIQLTKLFSTREIKNICRNKKQFDVRYTSHKFLEK